MRDQLRGLLFVALLLTAAAGPLPAAETNSCASCHEALDGALGAPAKMFTADIHSRYGFTCVDCHGGDPNSDDPHLSMSRARGFRGKIARTAVPQLCGGCHADAALIHKFRPQQRVDQLAQYRTSVHGKRLAAGDIAVANCVDCHGVHGIHEIKDPRSPVHPLRLPETCAACHSDTKRMAKYQVATTQFDEYRTSVHWEALAKRGDLSAPSCASCHGNHGATPPEVSSVGAVCGTCHVLVEDIFKESPHQEPFAAMGSGSCSVCHGHHAVQRPGVEMLAGDSSVCAQCHEPDSSGAVVADKMASALIGLNKALDRSDQALDRARHSGMEVSEADLQQLEAREQLVRARVAVHAFSTDAVEGPVNEGLALAARTLAAGESAMKERNYRRYGLAFSLVFIILTIIGLRMAIRTIESKPEATWKRLDAEP